MALGGDREAKPTVATPAHHRRGGLQLVAFRVLLVLGTSLPAAYVSSRAALELARNPYYTDSAAAVGRLPAIHLLRLFGDLPAGLAAAFMISALMLLLADQVLNAGALRWLMPSAEESRSGEGVRQRLSVWRTILDSGLEPLWGFLRIQLAMFVLLLLGILAINAGATTLQRHGQHAGWSGQTLLLLLPVGKAVAIMLWAALVGAWGFWCRLLTVADSRKRVRRTGLICLGLWWRFPGRAPLLFVGATTATTLLSGALLLVWRQHGQLWPLWLALWVAALALSAAVWYWLLRSGCRLYQQTELDSLRDVPDDPLRPIAALRRLFV
jgi:hypothetical protein